MNFTALSLWNLRTLIFHHDHGTKYPALKSRPSGHDYVVAQHIIERHSCYNCAKNIFTETKVQYMHWMTAFPMSWPNPKWGRSYAIIVSISILLKSDAASCHIFLLRSWVDDQLDISTFVALDNVSQMPFILRYSNPFLSFFTKCNGDLRWDSSGGHLLRWRS